MVEFMVMEILSDGNINGLGRHNFHAQPRIGEHISTDDDNGSAIFYEVINIIHPMGGDASTAGDIYLKQVYSASETGDINIFASKLAKGEI